MKVAIVPTVASALHGHPAARPGHDGKADVVDQVAQRAHHPGEDLRLGGRAAQPAVGHFELLDDRLLAPVGLDHALAGDRLLDDAVEVAQHLLLLAEALPRALGDQLAEDRHQRQR